MCHVGLKARVKLMMKHWITYKSALADTAPCGPFPAKHKRIKTSFQFVPVSHKFIDAPRDQTNNSSLHTNLLVFCALVALVCKTSIDRHFTYFPSNWTRSSPHLFPFFCPCACPCNRSARAGAASVPGPRNRSPHSSSAVFLNRKSTELQVCDLLAQWTG